MSLVTIEKVGDAGLAQIMRMRLEAEGIPVHVHSQDFNTLFGSTLGLGGVRIQVPAAFEQQARAVLDELRGELDADTEPDSD